MEKKRPIETIEVGRGVRANIWQNESKNGPWLSATVTRTYRNGEEFKDTYSMSFEDCLFFSKASDLAYEWIRRHRKRMKVQAANQE